MLTIIMNDNKDLVITTTATFYQRENAVDKIQFLFPEQYNDFDLSNATAILQYVDQANVAHTEILVKDDELYKNKLKYTLPVDTKITAMAGTIIMHCSMVKTNLENKTISVLHTGDVTITVLSRDDYYQFVTDESLEFVDKLIGSLDTKIEQIKDIANTYNLSKADNLSLNGNELQLTSNGQLIGNSVNIVGSQQDDNNEFTVVEF